MLANRFALWVLLILQLSGPKNGLWHCLLQYENGFQSFKRVGDPQDRGVAATLQGSFQENMCRSEHPWGWTGRASGLQLEALGPET